MAERKITTLFLDAMFTIFTALYGRWRLYQILLAQYAGILDIPESEIEKVYKAKRKEAEASEKKTEGKLPQGYYFAYWSKINGAIVRHFMPDLSEAEALGIGGVIYKRLMDDPEFFEVGQEMFAFLEEAQQRNLDLFIVSNQEEEGLWRLIQHFKIGCFFKGVIISDQVGYKKPDSRFFQAAIVQANVPVESIAFIGNNPHNDMDGAAAAGIEKRFLYDPKGEHSDTKSEVNFVALKDLQEVFDHV